MRTPGIVQLSRLSIRGTVQNNTGNPSMSPLTSSGNYAISGSGEGYICSINTSFSIDRIIGMVSHGIFIGSTTVTGNGYNDLFIAAPVGTEATNATLKGAASLEIIGPDSDTFQASLPVSAN